MRNSKIFCTTVDSSTSDAQLKTILDGLDATKSSCIGDFSEDEQKGIYDGIIKLSDTNKKIGIVLKLDVVITFTERMNNQKLVGHTYNRDSLKYMDLIYILDDAADPEYDALRNLDLVNYDEFEM